MNNFISDVYKFNKDIIGLEFPENPQLLSKERQLFALTAMYEELHEFTIAQNSENIPESLDALIDLIYFAIGRAYEMGISEEIFRYCWSLVQEKNMQKKRGKKNRGTDLDASKPEDWKAPDFSEVLK